MKKEKSNIITESLNGVYERHKQLHKEERRRRKSRTTNAQGRELSRLSGHYLKYHRVLRKSITCGEQLNFTYHSRQTMRGGK